MAEDNSTETDSRRNTPQPATGSTRSTRATRSQSREVSEPQAPKHSERVQRRPKPAAARSEDQGDGQISTRDRRKGAPKQTDLPTVNEDPSVVIDDEPGRDKAFENDEEHLPTSDLKSTGRVSGISGTTARTSNATQELAGLAPEDLNVLDALPDLLESAKKFLSGLLPKEISSKAIPSIRSSLQDKRSSLHRSRKRFMVDLESCHPNHSSSTFMDISKALPILYGTRDDQNADSDRIAPVFHAANLAILALNILLYPHQEDVLFLKNLDASFPNAFASDGHDQYLAINTRIQYAIEQLSKYEGRPNFDHDVVLNQVFYNEDGRTLRGYDPPTKQDRGYRGALTKTRDVIMRMRAVWTEERQSSPIKRLRDVYNWDDYVADMMIWISGKNEEVKAILGMIEIEIEDVVLSLKEALSEIRKVKQASGGDGDYAKEADDGQVDLSSYSPPSKPSGAPGQQDERAENSPARVKELASSDYLYLGSLRLADGVKSLKRAMARHPKASSSAQQALHVQLRPARAGSQVAAVAVPAARASTPQSDRAPLAPSSAPAQIQKDHESIGEDNDNGWVQHINGDDDGLGPQENDEEEDAFRTQQIHRENAERAFRLKKSREAESNKENQVESLQGPTEKRLIDPQENAQKEIWDSQNNSQDEGSQQTRHRPSSDRHILQPINKRSAPEPPATAGRSPAKRARFQSTAIGEGDDIPRASQVYNLANDAAKQMTALQPRATQTRKPWTEEETERLLELIEEFGTSWKQLKDEDQHTGILENRNQVALKDKARNMKFDFLKAGRMLPTHFDKIALSRQLIDKLSGLNIVYNPIKGTREDAEE